MKRLINLGTPLLLTALLAGCGGGGSGIQEVEIRPAGNEMRYEVTEFTVTAGQPVKIMFENVATAPSMQHNVVVLRSRDAIDRVGMGAIQAGAGRDFVPQDESVLAYTAIALPGQSVEVTFTAPEEPGAYPYICTFPGHYALMQGTMRVVE